MPTTGTGMSDMQATSTWTPMALASWYAHPVLSPMRNRADLHTHEDTANMTEHDFRSWVLRDLAASALLSCVAHFGGSHPLCGEDTRRSPGGEGSSASRQCRFTIHEWEPPWKKISQNLPNLQISTALANILTTTSTDPQTIS